MVFLGALCVSYLTIDDGAVSVTDAVLDASQDIQTGHEWLGLYHRDQRVGYAHLEKRIQGDEGYVYEVETHLKTQSFGSDISLDIDMEARLTKTLILKSFTFSISAGPAQFSGSGVVKEKTLELAVDTGGHTIKRSIALTAPPALKSVMGPRISRLDLTPGKIYQFPVFDPVTQGNQTVEIEVIGPDTVAVVDMIVPVTHIRQRVAGMTLNAWLNSRGEMLRQELGMGLVAVRETETQAKARAASGGVDLVAATKVVVQGTPSKRKNETSRVLLLTGEGLETFDLNDHRQTVVGPRITIRKELKTPGLPLSTDRTGLYLASEPLIQSDHPDVIKTARMALGAAKDTTEAALALMDWVHTHVEQKSVIGIPSAIETLQSRVGDCNEHTNLFIALARAVGVPSRQVVGLVYRDGQYGYHAWAEVNTQGGWLSVDPTWNEAPVGLGHLALLRGGLKEQAKLVRFFGKLKIEFVDPSAPTRTTPKENTDQRPD